MPEKPRFEFESPQNPEVRKIWDELRNESDRGMVIMAAAFLDNLLESLLKATMIRDEKIAQSLIGKNGPLGSFHGRVQAAMAFGLLSQFEHHDLNAIREIRNDFAHVTKPASFKNSEMVNKCNSFCLWKHAKDCLPSPMEEYCRDAKGRFGLLVATLAARLLERTRLQEHFKPLAESQPWNTFPDVIERP